jgi:hypothetical protein
MSVCLYVLVKTTLNCVNVQWTESTHSAVLDRPCVVVQYVVIDPFIVLRNTVFLSVFFISLRAACICSFNCVCCH